MTTTNDKLRSLFLAALMVFSVFAMTVALPGSAAANDTNYTQGEDYDDTLTSDSTYWQGQTLILTDDTYNSGTYELRVYDTSAEGDSNDKGVRSL